MRAISGDTVIAVRLTSAEVLRLLQYELKQALQTSSQPQVCVELFSGSGRVAKRWRQLGFGTLEFDVRKGPQYDLTNPVVLRILQGWITSGVIAVIWIGVPCSTWSLARRGKAGRPGGPIRTIEFINGLPSDQLTPQDVVKLALGNRTMRSAAFVIRLCVKNFIPVFLENPNSSRLWHAPPIRRLMDSSVCTSAVFDFCCFGTPWQKRTKLVGWHVGEATAIGRKCAGTLGRCVSGKFHLILRGNKPGTSVPWTRIAEPYPPRFVRVAADALIAAHDSLHLHRLFSLAHV